MNIKKLLLAGLFLFLFFSSVIKWAIQKLIRMGIMLIRFFHFSEKKTDRCIGVSKWDPTPRRGLELIWAGAKEGSWDGRHSTGLRANFSYEWEEMLFHIQLRHCFRDLSWRGQWGAGGRVREKHVILYLWQGISEKWSQWRRSLRYCEVWKKDGKMRVLTKEAERMISGVHEVMYVAWEATQKDSTHFQVAQGAVKGTEPRAVGVCSEYQFSANGVFSQRRYGTDFN